MTASHGTRRDARLAYATTAVGISAVSLIAPVLPELAVVYGVSTGEVAALQVAVLIPGIISARWLLGRGADGGLHRMLGITLLGYGIAGSALLWVTDFVPVLGFRVLQGFFCGGLVAGAFALLSSGDGRSQSRIAHNAALVCVMMAIQPLLGSALSTFGPRGPFAFYLLALPLSASMLAAASGNGIERTATTDSERPPPRTTRTEALTTTLVINALLFGWLLYFGPVHLAATFDAGVGLRGLMLSGQAVLGAVLALVVSGHLRRHRERSLLYIGLSVPILGLALVSVAPSLPAAFVGFLLIGVTYGVANPAVVSLLAQQGRQATGAWQSSARMGQVLGPALAGWLVARTGATEVLLIGVAIGLVGLLRLAAGDVLRRRGSSTTTPRLSRATEQRRPYP